MKQQHASDPLLLRFRQMMAEAQLLLRALLLSLAEYVGLWKRDRVFRVEMLEELRELRRRQAMAVFLAAQERMARTAGAPACNGAEAGNARASGTTVCRRGRRRSGQQPNFPRGFKRSKYVHGRRIVWRVVCAGRGLRGRLEALRAAHENSETLVVRMIARLTRRRIAAYIMTHAPKERCVALARVEERVCDTS